MKLFPEPRRHKLTLYLEPVMEGSPDSKIPSRSLVAKYSNPDAVNFPLSLTADQVAIREELLNYWKAREQGENIAINSLPSMNQVDQAKLAILLLMKRDEIFTQDDPKVIIDNIGKLLNKIRETQQITITLKELAAAVENAVILYNERLNSDSVFKAAEERSKSDVSRILTISISSHAPSILPSSSPSPSPIPSPSIPLLPAMMICATPTPSSSNNPIATELFQDKGCVGDCFSSLFCCYGSKQNRVEKIHTPAPEQWFPNITP